jgi:hypothetical protein
MSKKRRSRNARRTSTSVRSDLQRVLHKEYPNDPRLLFTGWGLLLIGIILWFLATHFMWSGWVKALIDPIDMGLMGVGIALVSITTIGIAQGSQGRGDSLLLYSRAKQP